jgi:ketosteroid isomerase-like protein
MRFLIPAFVAAGIALSIVSADARTKPDPRSQVFAAESSFAATMAARDLKAFGSYVAADAVFFGRRGVMRGNAAVVDAWKSYFEGPKAPFSWRPEVVEVLDSGKLAHSSGPVTDPDGKLIGMFNSVWRLEPDGRWRVVFDKGCSVCDSTHAPPKPSDPKERR